MKTLTYKGHRYSLSLEKFSGRIIVKGPGLLTPAYLPEDINEQSGNIRAFAIRSIEKRFAKQPPLWWYDEDMKGLY